MKKISFRIPDELNRSLNTFSEKNKINTTDAVVKLLGAALQQTNPKMVA
jgi:hypothetical protein